MRVSLDFIGEDLVAAEIVGYGVRAQDLRPAFRRSLRVIHDAVDRQFSSQGAYGSGGWRPLAPSTVAEKAAKGLDPRIMHRSYALRDSLLGKNAYRIQRVNRQSLVYGTHVDYAVYHQRGTSKMPRRRLVQLTNSDRRLIVRSIYERVMAEATVT